MTKILTKCGQCHISVVKIFSRENFDESPKISQFYQYFPLSEICAIHGILCASVKRHIKSYDLCAFGC